MDPSLFVQDGSTLTPVRLMDGEETPKNDVRGMDGTNLLRMAVVEEGLETSLIGGLE